MGQTRVGLAAFVLGICVLAPLANAADEVVARIGDRAITKKEFDEKFVNNLKFFKFKAPTRENVLDDMVKIEVGMMEAKKLGLERDPVVQEQIRQVLYQALVDKMVAPRFKSIKISDDDLKKYYDENPEIRTSHIFVGVKVTATKDEDAKAYQKIKEIQDKLRSTGKSFAEIAREYSEGVAAQAGGDIDWQTKDKLDPTYFATAKKLKVGDVSPIVRSQFGYHLIKLTGLRKFEEANQADARRMLFDEKRIEIFDAYMDQIRKKYKITVNKALLN